MLIVVSDGRGVFADGVTKIKRVCLITSDQFIYTGFMLKDLFRILALHFRVMQFSVESSLLML